MEDGRLQEMDGVLMSEGTVMDDPAGESTDVANAEAADDAGNQAAEKSVDEASKRASEKAVAESIEVATDKARAATVKVPVIYVVSDSLGELGATVASAAARQFLEGSSIIHRLPNVVHLEQIVAYLSTILKKAKGEIAVFHTIASSELRRELEAYLADKPVRSVDLIGPAIEAIAAVTDTIPKGEPGLFRKTDEDYFDRLEAMSFAVEHDDGRNTQNLKEADIVIIGVSRSSKTPLSVYLATFGHKVANIPLVLGVEPPAQLFDVDPKRIFGLTSNARLLADIRKHRLGNAVGVASAYAEQSVVQDDLDAARRLMRKLGCIVLHTDGRSIEETAGEILRYYELAFP